MHDGSQLIDAQPTLRCELAVWQVSLGQYQQIPVKGYFCSVKQRQSPATTIELRTSVSVPQWISLDDCSLSFVKARGMGANC